MSGWTMDEDDRVESSLARLHDELRTRCEARGSKMPRGCPADATEVVENAVGSCRALCSEHADVLDWPRSEFYTSVAEYAAQLANELSMSPRISDAGTVR